MQWQWIAVGYTSYLALVSMTRPEFESARRPLALAAALTAVSLAAAAVVGQSEGPLDAPTAVILPALVLLAGYRLSGLLFVRPDLRIERWLRSVDDTILRRCDLLAWSRRAPRAITAYFELSYLLVYVAVPAGAVTLALAGHPEQIGRFWAVVLLAEFTCYGMLPWVQTRPPRLLEALPEGTPDTLLRRLNLDIVNRASIRVNTVPSGHAAGALATALAVGSTMPAAGAVFLVLAASIAVATVLGRYHYVVDSALGVLVAIAAWTLV